MQVIPVIDLLGGQAVRGVRGERTDYRPVVSQRCTTSDPLAVARALLDATGSPTLYIADLGAILGHGAHFDTLVQLCRALPGRELWLDAGFAGFDDMRALLLTLRERIGANSAAVPIPVFGTETLHDRQALPRAQAAGFNPLLSLDYRHGAPMGEDATGGSATSSAPGADPAWWPKRIIVMTLDRVGAYGGPDLAAFQRIRALAGERAVFGAGGVRSDADLAQAKAAGAAGWLVASALHDRRIAP